eukprot:220753-Amphidinium_carterae.2
MDNKANIKERVKAWRGQNQEYVREKAQRYKEENKERLKEQSNIWKEKTKINYNSRTRKGIWNTKESTEERQNNTERTTRKD